MCLNTFSAQAEENEINNSDKEMAWQPVHRNNRHPVVRLDVLSLRRGCYNDKMRKYTLSVKQGNQRTRPPKSPSAKAAQKCFRKTE